jgi:hypothetical protein
VSDLNADIAEGHLSTAVSHLAKIACRLERTLTFDPKRERFVSDPEADRHLTKEYRTPYVVPEAV